MTTGHATETHRILTPEELATCIRLFREMRGWSQEQLAEIAGLNVRTVQRVERAESAAFDTRRALARAFELDDIDTFTKPFCIPNPEQVRAAEEQFDRDHVTLDLLPIDGGRQLAGLAEACEADLSQPAANVPTAAVALFAELVDSLREYRDCAELYSEVQKLEVYDDFQRRIDDLKAAGACLRYAERRLHVGMAGYGDRGTPMTALYLMAFRRGHAPAQMAAPRVGRMGF